MKFIENHDQIRNSIQFPHASDKCTVKIFLLKNAQQTLWKLSIVFESDDHPGGVFGPFIEKLGMVDIEQHGIGRNTFQEKHDMLKKTTNPIVVVAGNTNTLE